MSLLLFLPHAFPILSSCLPQRESLQHYKTTQKKGKRSPRWRWWWGFLQWYSSVYYSKRRWLTGGTPLLPLMSFLFLLYFCRVLFVSTSPWHFHVLFCLVFLYLNLYLLFRLLLNLSVISKRKKINKKNTKCLKILYRHRF